MSALDIRVEVNDRLSARLNAAARAGADLTEPMALVAERLLQSTRARFKTQTGLNGVPWAKRAGNVDPERPLLFKSGDLQRGIEQRHGRDFAEVGVLATGGPARYAAIQQFGGTVKAKPGKALKTPFGPRGAVTIPARPYLGADEADRLQITLLLTDHLDRAFAGDGAVE